MKALGFNDTLPLATLSARRHDVARATSAIEPKGTTSSTLGRDSAREDARVTIDYIAEQGRRIQDRDAGNARRTRDHGVTPEYIKR